MHAGHAGAIRLNNYILIHGHRMHVTARSEQEPCSHAAFCISWQMVLLQDFDISDEDMVKYAISRSNVVINLIGQRMETMNYSFEDVHVRWPERLAK